MWVFGIYWDTFPLLWDLNMKYFWSNVWAIIDWFSIYAFNTRFAFGVLYYVSFAEHVWRPATFLDQYRFSRNKSNFNISKSLFLGIIHYSRKYADLQTLFYCSRNCQVEIVLAINNDRDYPLCTLYISVAST